jgi:hypothetical protein
LDDNVVSPKRQCRFSEDVLKSRLFGLPRRLYTIFYTDGLLGKKSDILESLCSFKKQFSRDFQIHSNAVNGKTTAKAHKTRNTQQQPGRSTLSTITMALPEAGNQSNQYSTTTGRTTTGEDS